MAENRSRRVAASSTLPLTALCDRRRSKSRSARSLMNKCLASSLALLKRTVHCIMNLSEEFDGTMPERTQIGFLADLRSANYHITRYAKNAAAINICKQIQGEAGVSSSSPDSVNVSIRKKDNARDSLARLGKVRP